MMVTTMANQQSCDLLTDGATIKIALLRHAQTNLHGCFCGHLDPGLSACGQEQISAIVQSLSSLMPHAIWSSDLRRARETAEPIARHFGLDYETSPGLREMNFGAWEGLTWTDVELQYPEDARAWARLFPHHRPPGGESFPELQTRVVGQLEQLVNHAEPGCTLVVTHAGFIRTAVAWVLGVPSDRISRIVQDHGAVTIVENLRNHWTVTALNISASWFSDVNRNQIGDRR